MFFTDANQQEQVGPLGKFLYDETIKIQILGNDRAKTEVNDFMGFGHCLKKFDQGWIRIPVPKNGFVKIKKSFFYLKNKIDRMHLFIFLLIS